LAEDWEAQIPNSAILGGRAFDATAVCLNTPEQAPNGIDHELKRLYYDTAGTAYRPAIAALTSLVPTTQILFGSDNPFVPLAEIAEGILQSTFRQTIFNNWPEQGASRCCQR
jgi:hypothetical protein